MNANDHSPDYDKCRKCRSHTGKLYKILLALPVTQDCAKGARRVAVKITAVVWIGVVVMLSVLAYNALTSNRKPDYRLAPFVTYIDVPKDIFTVTRICGLLPYILVFPGVIIFMVMYTLIVYILYREFKKLKNNFRRAVDERGHLNGDLSSFRRRHQTLSRAVGKVDGFMMINNVGGLVCHIASIVILLYLIIFNDESTASSTSTGLRSFWLSMIANVLLISATAAILVHHAVRIYTMRLRVITLLSLAPPGIFIGGL